MQISVTAPTGHVGSRVARLLVQAGVRPVLLVRDPARLDPQLRARAEVRTVDLGDRAAVCAATTDVDAAFWLDALGEAAPDPVAASAAFGATIAAAVTANRIGRNVFLSSIGAELRHGAGVIDGLAGIEEQLAPLAADVLVLRCGYFFTNLLMDVDGLRGGTVTAARSADQRMAWVDPRDIGDVVAARLLSDSWSGHQVQAVHGPADLSYAEVAEILSAAVGLPLTFRRVADADVLRDLVAAGLPETAAAAIVAMTAGTREGFVPEQPRDYVTTTPTSLGEWAFAHLRPRLQAG